MPTSFGMYGSRGSNCCFADDSVPAKLDQIAAFGELGFNQPGVLPCPDAPPPIGACCLGCSCTVVQQTECDAMGGTFMGPNTSCSPNICGEPPAVCCVNEQCTIVTSCECQALGGEYFPGADTCSPNPCEPLGACCLECDCIRMRASECTAQGGEFHGAESHCTPSPCGTEPAACCVGESCYVVSSCGCEQLGGEFLSDVPTCDGEPCVPPTQTKSETWGRVKARYR